MRHKIVFAGWWMSNEIFRARCSISTECWIYIVERSYNEQWAINVNYRPHFATNTASENFTEIRATLYRATNDEKQCRNHRHVRKMWKKNRNCHRPALALELIKDLVDWFRWLEKRKLYITTPNAHRWSILIAMFVFWLSPLCFSIG